MNIFEKIRSNSNARVNTLYSDGILDYRKIMVAANAKSLPNGGQGLCLLCLNGNCLNIYDTNLKSELKELMYTIELNKTTQFKSSSFVLNSYIKFNYNNFKYVFRDFAGAKDFISAIKSELNTGENQ